MSEREKTRRLFLGSFPTKEEMAALRAVYESRQSPVEIKVNWVPPENWHVTWLFLGNVPEERLGYLQEQLANCLQSTPSFALEFEQITLWPNKRRPHMLVWEGKPTVEAKTLHRLLCKGLTEFINSGEVHRHFKPHLTLARIKTSRSKSPKTHPKSEQMALLLPQIHIQQSLSIQTMTLMESRLTSHGALYSPIQAFSLT